VDADVQFDYVYELVMWDGTRQTLSICFDELLSPDQQISSWEIIVQRRVFVWATYLLITKHLNT